MAKKKNIPAEATAEGEAHIANLKTLNILLVKDTVELREQNNQLRFDLASMAADHDILDATEREVFGLVLSSSLSDAATETAGTMQKKAESAIVDLNAAEMRLLVAAREKDGVVRDLERVMEERDLSRSDLDEKRKELVDLEESFRSLEQADAKCGELEEEGKRREEMFLSVMYEKDFLERCREDDKRFVETLMREMEVMKSQKDVQMEILKENKANGLKVEALEEECRLLKEIRGRLANKVGDLEACLEELKEEKVELVARYADSEKRYARVEEDLKRNLIEFGRLEKKKLELEKTFNVKEEEMTLQINELTENMTKMAAEKTLADQRSAEYEIQISNLQAEISELQSARKILANKEAYCAAVQRENDLKAEEAVALRMQLKESMKARHIVEVKLKELQIKFNHLTTENEETKKHIDSLMVEKATLEKHLETSNRRLHDIKKKLKTSGDASGQVFALLKKTITEVVGEERVQENCISRETGVKVENDEEMKLFVDNLEAIKQAVKGKETKIKDLNQELELLQLSVVANAKNKGGMWKWLFPATTTIFAAISLAYAAKAR